jgi:CubicO group peptidase (beta-lactamase class C family)
MHDKKPRIYFKPGSRFAYSGEGIDLAQMVVETVTKKSSERTTERTHLSTSEHDMHAYRLGKTI